MRIVRTTILLLLVGLSACPGGDGRPRPGATGSVAPVRGGVLRVLLSDDVDALDPQRAAAPPSFGLMRALHRGLMAFPAAPAPVGARPVPDLAATDPEVSPDGLRYTFRLREDIAFGPPASHPVRAVDVKAGLDRIFTVGSPLARYFGVIAGVSAPDEDTVVVQLARPVNDLLWLLALPAASAIPSGLTATPRPDQISASGPYRLAEKDGYVPEHKIHLVRNDAWVEKSDPVRGAWVDEITIEIGATPAEIQRRLADGRADLSEDAGPPPLVSATPPSSSTEQLVHASNGCLRYVFMNTRIAPFSSGRVRAAVAASIDRTAVAAAFVGGTAAATILPPTVDGYDASRAVPAPDPKALRRILARTKYRNGFATRLVVGDRPADRAEAAAVARALRRAGIRVAVSAAPIASLYEDRYEIPSARVPMGIATWCTDWPGLGGRAALAPLVDGRTVAARGNTNYSGINDPGLNRAMDAAAVQQDPERASDAWRQVDRRAVGLAVVVPLAHLTERSLLGPRVRGFVPHPYFIRGDLTAVWLQENG